MTFTNEELRLISLALFNLRMDTCASPEEAALDEATAALAEKIDAALI